NQDELPAVELAAAAGQEVRPLDVEPALVRVVVAEVLADGAAEVEVVGPGPSTRTSGAGAGERLAYFGGHPLHELAYDLFDDPAGQAQDVWVHEVLGPEHRL